MGISNVLCYGISRRLALRRQPGEFGHNPASFTQENYAAWRQSALQVHYDKYFGRVKLAGLDVLDFGCGHGRLSCHIATLGPNSVTGIELKPDLVRFATEQANDAALDLRPRFITALDSRTINLPDNSMDLIVCFDVVEHIMDYQSIFREWRRVLRPAGRVFIVWIPWFNPGGAHIASLVPIPWCHVLFPEKTLINTCVRIYDLAAFKPRHWDLDKQGRKKPNKWRGLAELPGVNRLTIRQFERTVRQVGFGIDRRSIVGFGGSRIARTTNFLTSVPVIRDFFTSHTVFELRNCKPIQPDRDNPDQQVRPTGRTQMANDQLLRTSHT